MLKQANLITSILILSVGTEFHIPEDQLLRFQTGLDVILENIHDDVNHSQQSRKFSVKAPEDFSRSRVARDSGCPGGEGNYGFNSFNFMTFVLLVFNLVTADILQESIFCKTS